MHFEAFCYFGLSKAPDRLRALIPLLPEPDRGITESFLKDVEGLPEDERARRWSDLRKSERKRGASSSLPPILRRYLNGR